MALNIQSIRGMNDILPAQSFLWQWMEKRIHNVLSQYGYNEIRLPLLEDVKLFERSVGEITDIVTKEMYDFQDKSGRHITLRPEGTSGCVRAAIEHNLSGMGYQRLWYQGPMFRYERPQKGRLRQFTQLGVETFGMAGADIDAELIILTRDIFRSLNLLDKVNLEINSLGDSKDRAEYHKILIQYLTDNYDQLDEDSQYRLDKNPLRILDSKNPDMQPLLNRAPKLLDYLSEDSQKHFTSLCKLLTLSGIEYTINPRLVRGLDYYNKTVFEWVTSELGSQSTVCGGGRYDGLFELFGSKTTPASGFAIGLERLLLLLEMSQDLPTSNIDIIITNESNDANDEIVATYFKIRDIASNFVVLNDFSFSSIKKQHNRARNKKPKLIITIRSNSEINIWDLRDNKHYDNETISSISKLLSSLL
ncbi:histidine--tRNA ligase [Photobacterium toruni]|uniref:histidine--tRNA ligase n=1 Tax=Photobacterium TaxID=657 RepID=UPI0007F96F7A|nr:MULTISPECIES: histidine--tRNA ligase [Photobacterium]MEC6816696.1 histidine--tRNA ligase [Photobacterium toruni]OBU42141.1 histidine--tRNA ligase [Photobacterium phosphoreum]